jgi:predicted ATPase/DNA-binding winged helix-turn-helix (wHTH) protein
MSSKAIEAARDEEILFGPFRFLSRRGLLFRDAAPVRLGSRAREILRVLVERAGQMVTKNELIALVWPNTIVEEGTLRVHIAWLRKALGDSKAEARYVENVTGRGYRFIAPVSCRKAAAPPNELPPVTAQDLLAPLTPIIGRETTCASVAERLERSRLVSLVGPGGVGKTTVAINVAHRLRASYPDGVLLAELTSLGNYGHAWSGLTAQVAALASKRVLLVLDTCECAIEAAASAAEKMLASAPGLSILATSREPLRARGEWVLRLGPLETAPRNAALTAVEACGFPAIRLFVERAMATLNAFELNDSNAPVIADICRELEGLPLAIELAAARLSLFDLRSLAARLEDCLGLLTRGCRTAPPRQQTLRATLDWSYDTLSALERTALRRLGAFAGDFNLESAGAVIADADLDASELPDLLTSLIAKSLLIAHGAERHGSYRLLASSRAYAREMLDSSSEGNEIRRRYAQLTGAVGDRATRPHALRAESYKKTPPIGIELPRVAAQRPEAA